jgi:hypothetical protein
LKNTEIVGTRFIQSNDKDTHPQSQLKSSIKGQKLKCSDIPSDRVLSPIYLFLWQKKGNSC